MARSKLPACGFAFGASRTNRKPRRVSAGNPFFAAKRDDGFAGNERTSYVRFFTVMSKAIMVALIGVDIFDCLSGRNGGGRDSYHDRSLESRGP